MQTAVEIQSPSRTSKRVGFSDNVSAGGMLFRTASRFRIGDTLSIRFSTQGNDEETFVEALVVRTHPVPMTPTPVMPFMTAVSFLKPVADFAP